MTRANDWLEIRCRLRLWFGIHSPGELRGRFAARCCRTEKRGLQGRSWKIGVDHVLAYYMDVATDSQALWTRIRKASRARAPDSPMSGEGMDTRTARPTNKGQGPDGGVDLGLTKNGLRYLVQCKHWRKRQVGVTVVRELFGVMSAQGAHGGFVVTGGQFSREAQAFADSCGIKLIDGRKLEELIGDIPSRNSAADSGVAVVAVHEPMCPQCGTAMIQRTAKKGQFAGQRFWGCGRYPKCREILKIS